MTAPDGVHGIDQAPAELAVAISEFWPPEEWDNAANVAFLESKWNPFALNDTRDAMHPCGAVVGFVGSVKVTAELSVGYFQVNACNYPTWEWQRLYNARHNAGTAHMIWAQTRDWSAWRFSAQKLNLL